MRPPTARSSPHRVVHAFLGEAVLSHASELLLPRLGRAGSRCVPFALRHEALERRARELLVGSLGFAGRVLRKSGGRERRQQCSEQHLLHRILLRLCWGILPRSSLAAARLYTGGSAKIQ